MSPSSGRYIYICTNTYVVFRSLRRGIRPEMDVLMCVMCVCIVSVCVWDCVYDFNECFGSRKAVLLFGSARSQTAPTATTGRTTLPRTAPTAAIPRTGRPASATRWTASSAASRSCKAQKKYEISGLNSCIASERVHSLCARIMADLPRPAVPDFGFDFLNMGAFFSMSGRIMKRIFEPRM